MKFVRIKIEIPRAFSGGLSEEEGFHNKGLSEKAAKPWKTKQDCQEFGFMIKQSGSGFVTIPLMNETNK